MIQRPSKRHPRQAQASNKGRYEFIYCDLSDLSWFNVSLDFTSPPRLEAIPTLDIFLTKIKTKAYAAQW